VDGNLIGVLKVVDMWHHIESRDLNILAGGDVVMCI
jgi:hypothetical protein